MFGNIEISGNTLTLDCIFWNVIVFLWFILVHSEFPRIMLLYVSNNCTSLKYSYVWTFIRSYVEGEQITLRFD